MVRIHVIGAAGSGTTTLARAIAGRLRIPHFDSDSYYWIPTVPPYKTKRDKPVRDLRMREDLHRFDDWVWSGSAVSWKHGSEDRLELCVFLTLPAELRLNRLRLREEQEHAKLPYVTKAEIERELEDFMEWAARYDEDGLEVRSRVLHEEWLATLTCPVLRIDGDGATNAHVAQVLDTLRELDIEQMPNPERQ